MSDTRSIGTDLFDFGSSPSAPLSRGPRIRLKIVFDGRRPAVEYYRAGASTPSEVFTPPVDCDDVIAWLKKEVAKYAASAAKQTMDFKCEWPLVAVKTYTQAKRSGDSMFAAKVRYMTHPAVALATDGDHVDTTFEGNGATEAEALELCYQAKRESGFSFWRTVDTKTVSWAEFTAKQG